MTPTTLPAVLHTLVRPTRVVAILTIVACAVFAARTAAALVAASYLPPEVTAARPVPVARAVAAPHVRDRTGTQLVERNMFCSSCGPAVPTTGGDLAMAPAVLIEISVGGEPRATVRVLTSEVQGSWGLGDAIPGLGRLARIGARWIELTDGTGRHGRLWLVDPAAGRGPDTAMSDGPPAAADPCGTRCRRLDDHTVEVERNLVRELVTGAARPGAMRFLPQVDHGEVKGVKLYGVTPTTIAYALGMKNGDTLTTVDGAPLTNLQQLLDLYAKLDQVNRVELSGLRGGKPLAIDLRLR